MAGERRTIPPPAARAVAGARLPGLARLFGADFDFVETRYFGRWPFALGASWDAWTNAVGALFTGEPQTRAITC